MAQTQIGQHEQASDLGPVTTSSCRPAALVCGNARRERAGDRLHALPTPMDATGWAAASNESNPHLASLLLIGRVRHRREMTGTTDLDSVVRGFRRPTGRRVFSAFCCRPMRQDVRRPSGRSKGLGMT